jgi:hypothetical protein
MALLSRRGKWTSMPSTSVFLHLNGATRGSLNRHNLNAGPNPTIVNNLVRFENLIFSSTLKKRPNVKSWIDCQSVLPSMFILFDHLGCFKPCLHETTNSSHNVAARHTHRIDSYWVVLHRATRCDMKIALRVN